MVVLYIFYFLIEDYFFINNSLENYHNRKKLIGHFIIFIGASLILIIINFRATPYIISYLILHLIIDNFVKWLNKRVKKRYMTYLIHQGLHLGLIFLTYLVLANKYINFLDFIPNELLRWLLFIIIILKPVNTTFKILFEKYAPEETENNGKTVEGAGAVIGNLERILITILLYNNQFGAIGLVFTAKSVARYDRISKDPVFAEYYLIGSLYSIICVLSIYGLII